jgi:hypothetical protein
MKITRVDGRTGDRFELEIDASVEREIARSIRWLVGATAALLALRVVGLDPGDVAGLWPR